MCVYRMAELEKHLSSPVFDNILSIGYEFETNTLTKLSMSNDGSKYYSDMTAARNLGDGSSDFAMENDQQEDIAKHDYVETICNQEDRKVIKFCFFSDIGSLRHKSITSLCEDTSKRQNNWWKIIDGEKERPILLTKDNFCNFFPNLEWNITFYQPNYQHKVLDSFKKAVDLILEQLVTMTHKPVELVRTTREGEEKKHIDTWLLGNTFLRTGMNPFLMKPQLTFTCKIENLIDIVRAFLFKGVRSFLYEIFSFLKKCKLSKKQKGYLFLIMAMAKAFSMRSSKEKYFKNLMSFLPRHKIVELISFLDMDAIFNMGVELPKYADDVLKSADEQHKLDKDNHSSTLFPLQNDIVFIEVRSFAGIVGYFLNISSTLDMLHVQDVLNPGRRDISSLFKLIAKPKRKTRGKRSSARRSRKEKSSKDRSSH